MIIIPDEQGYAGEGDGEFKDKDINVIHNRLTKFKVTISIESKKFKYIWSFAIYLLILQPEIYK